MPGRRRGVRKTTRRSRRDPAVRERALEALQRMRSDGLSLTRATREARTTPRTVRKYVGATLKKTPSGRYAATPSDRLTRRVWFLTKYGKVEIAVRGSRPASRVASYMAAVNQYLLTGKTEALTPFRGKAIRARNVTYRFLTDQAALGQLAHAGEVSFERLYVLRA